MRFWSKLPLFWRFQLAGWSAFVVVTLPLKIDIMGSVSAALFLSVTRDGTSFLLTLALRALYRAYWSEKGGQMAVLIIGACTGAGMLQNGLFILLRETLPLDSEIFRYRSIAFSVFYERVGLLYSWSFLYFGMRQALQGKQHQLELALAKSARQGAEIQMLRAQMNPHFLFNALNSIQTNVETVNPNLGRMVQSLSDFLRFSLDHSDRDFLPLGREFDAMCDYLAVEKSRFREKLECHCEIDELARAVLVPGIILQPLVENAVKYGRETSEPPVRIRVQIVRVGASTLQIIVSNSGEWLEPASRDKESHLGLQNLRRRLVLIYPDKHQLDIVHRDGSVTVTICLPIL